MILVTGGCGFIGTNFVRAWTRINSEQLVNLDALAYCGRRENLQDLEGAESYKFAHGNICDPNLVAALLAKYQPRAIVHFAAESHVDRSISDAFPFVQTNVLGTQVLLECALRYWRDLRLEAQKLFRFLHISTDEVYGSLTEAQRPFTEASPFAPTSPYAASKASADLLVTAYGRTHGLPVLISNCSNNYGPFQYPEKLIPLTLLRLQRNQKIPVYGDGRNIRDWLHVEDHINAIRLILDRGMPGETYNIGANCEKRNVEVVRLLCCLAARFLGRTARDYEDLIEFVRDRPGHDFRYAIDSSKIRQELGWTPKWAFEDGLSLTVQWYLENRSWLQSVAACSYDSWVKSQYGGTI